MGFHWTKSLTNSELRDLLASHAEALTQQLWHDAGMQCTIDTPSRTLALDGVCILHCKTCICMQVLSDFLG